MQIANKCPRLVHFIRLPYNQTWNDIKAPIIFGYKIFEIKTYLLHTLLHLVEFITNNNHTVCRKIT